MELTFTEKNGFPVFDIPADAPPFDLIDVKRWEDELDRVDQEKYLRQLATD